MPDNYAVVCRKNTEEKYALMLVGENIKDYKNNRTEFSIYKLPEMDYSETNKPS